MIAGHVRHAIQSLFPSRLVVLAPALVGAGSLLGGWRPEAVRRPRCSLPACSLGRQRLVCSYVSSRRRKPLLPRGLVGPSSQRKRSIQWLRRSLPSRSGYGRVRERWIRSLVGGRHSRWSKCFVKRLNEKKHHSRQGFLLTTRKRGRGTQCQAVVVCSLLRLDCAPHASECRDATMTSVSHRGMACCSIVCLQSVHQSESCCVGSGAGNGVRR